MSASLEMSDWLALPGAAAPSSTQVPPSTEPPNAGGLPLPSGYWVMIVDQLSEPVPTPLKKLVR